MLWRSASTASSTAWKPTPRARRSSGDRRVASRKARAGLCGEEPNAKGEGADSERNRAGPEDDDGVGGLSQVLPSGRGEEPARHQDRGDRYAEPSDASGEAREVGRVDKDLADEAENDEHTRVRVPSTGEGLLKVGHRDP